MASRSLGWVHSLLRRRFSKTLVYAEWDGAVRLTRRELTRAGWQGLPEDHPRSREDARGW